MDFKNKCHVCGTFGKKWENEKDIFFCPNCQSIYSNYGVVMDSRRNTEILTFWN